MQKSGEHKAVFPLTYLAEPNPNYALEKEGDKDRINETQRRRKSQNLLRHREKKKEQKEHNENNSKKGRMSSP